MRLGPFIVGVFGITDLQQDWKELAIGFKWRGIRKAKRLCKVPFSTRQVLWSELVYERNVERSTV